MPLSWLWSTSFGRSTVLAMEHWIIVIDHNIIPSMLVLPCICVNKL
uniref:Uncharacterized protein n=1 Tax=Triticum urartu TaxID=4572 RepID=A0A8R7K2M0_TRIUA